MNIIKIIQLLSVLLAVTLLSCAASDRDRDGIPDKIDQCPISAEDFDKFEDVDGCPDKDNDKDGVPDNLDQCPDIPEDRDGFEDVDGCPEFDNDKDGIKDQADLCPDQKEDLDNFEDVDGCPEFDNDKDGVLDVDDKCPLAPEDRDGFEDEDGCPDLDNDNDGIKDEADKCPNRAEIFNGFEDSDGCPDSDSDPLPPKLELNIEFIDLTDSLSNSSKIMIEKKVIPGLKTWHNHQVYIFVFMLNNNMELHQYLTLLNNRTRSIHDFIVSKGISRSQLKIRTITPELYQSSLGRNGDFNKNRPVIFKRVIK